MSTFRAPGTGATATTDPLTPGQDESAPSMHSAADTARLALRRVASGVTVLTINQRGLRHGATASAVVTMSREPLMLGVCLRRASMFASMVRQVRLFSVNVLTTTQADIAARFADPRRPLGDAQFADLDWWTDEVTGAPLIGDCLANMACRISDWSPVGDHDLLSADVLRGELGSGQPLLSFGGRLQPGPADPPATPQAREQRAPGEAS